MTLSDLPAEVILIIIKHLDLKSIQSVYNTCRYLRNVVCMNGSVKKCDISMSTLATAKILKTNIFKCISEHLLELNMRGVPNLYKTLFYPALKKLKSLITLDVSYTYLNLDDLREVCRSCPNLKNICINVLIVVTNDLLPQYQDDFKRLENVHFIGKIMHFNPSLMTLRKAKINNFKYTVLDRKFMTESYLNAKCKQLFMYFIDLDNTDMVAVWDSLPSLLGKGNDFEYILINKSTLCDCFVYSSLVFSNFFEKEFGLETKLIDQGMLKGNTVLMLFDKECNNFDDIFFWRLSKEIKQYLPYFYKSNTETLGATDSDWFFITPMAKDMQLHDLQRCELAIKKKRTGEPNFVLDYDAVFKAKQSLKLSIGFKDNTIRYPVELRASSDYLRKLTFLRLTGTKCYSPNFFNILFQSCSTLVTLDIECHSATSQWTLDIAKYITLSKCLKNVRLCGRSIKFNKLFISLSKCKTLEKIHLQDSSSYTYNLSDVSIEFGDPSILIEKCDKLYSLYIYAPIPMKARAQISQKLNKTKAKLGKCYLNLVLLCKSFEDTDRYTYQTYPMDMFDKFVIRFC